MGSSNAAGYDSHTDTMVMVFSRGMNQTVGVYELAFDGSPASPVEPAEPAPIPPTSSGQLAISNIQISDLTQTSATITWTTNEPADSYVYHGSNVSALTAPAANTSMNGRLTTAHRVILYNLFYNTTYYYKIRSTNAIGNTAETAIASLKTLINVSETEPPTSPAPVVVMPAGPNAINISWTASTDNVRVIGYRIFRNGTL